MVIGLPSLAGLLYFGGMLLALRPSRQSNAPCQADSLTRIIGGTGAAIAFPFRILAWFGRWLVAVLAALSLMGLVLSAGIWSLDDALRNQVFWARPAAFGAAVSLLVAGTLFALTRGPRLIRLTGVLLLVCGVSLLRQAAA